MIPRAAQLAERFELFSTWSPQALEVLRSKLAMRTLAAGEVLVREGAHASSAFLLWEGELVVHLRLRGRTEEIGRISPGSVAAEVSLLDPGPATATVLAQTQSQVLELSRANLDGLRAMHPRAAADLLEVFARVLAARVREGTERLEGLRGMPEAEPAKPSLLDAMRSLIGLGRGRSGGRA